MGADEVLAFPFDAAAGKVGEKVQAYRAAPGSGPRHLLCRHGLVYLLNELGNTIVVLRPESGGTLAELQCVSTLPPGFADFSHTAHPGLSADGRHLYVSNRGHDSLTLFDVGPDGLVIPREWFPSGGQWPWFFTLAGDGRMLVANNMSDNVALFDVGSDGRLHPAGQAPVRRPVFLASVG